MTNFRMQILLFTIAPVLVSCGWGDTWTDPELAKKEDPAFSFQGEYGLPKTGQEWAIQVVAMGGAKLDAYLLEGGFPGFGFSKENRRIHLTGKLNGEKAFLFSEDNGARIVLDGKSATLDLGGQPARTLPRIERVSPTLGMEPPQGAIVLFDGTSVDAWENGEMVDGLLRNNDVRTKRTFGSYFLHLEFRTPYKPSARGQFRGNSGLYHQYRYETQVLDSFGLEGKMNEAGGIYSIAAPRLNMCQPPLTWQTYDVDLKTAEFDEAGNRTKPAVISVKLNGVVIHENQPLPDATPGAGLKVTPEPGPIFLQGHGNPVFYRNIWLIDREEE